MVFDAERRPIPHIRCDAHVVIRGGNECFGVPGDDGESVNVEAA